MITLMLPQTTILDCDDHLNIKMCYKKNDFVYDTKMKNYVK